jgi:hypothetical protein
VPAGQLPREPRVDRAEGKIAGGACVREQPLELRRREVRVGDESCPRADQVGGELGAAIRGAPVLPDERGRDGIARRAIPEHRRLPLVRDPDRAQLGRAHVRGGECRCGGLENGLPDLLRVVLDEPGRGKVLDQLTIAAPAN